VILHNGALFAGLLGITLLMVQLLVAINGAHAAPTTQTGGGSVLGHHTFDAIQIGHSLALGVQQNRPGVVGGDPLLRLHHQT